MKKISALRKRPQRDALSSLCEDTAVYEQESVVSPKNETLGTLTLDFPAFRTVRNRFLLFKLLSRWYFVIAAWADKVK